MNPTTTTPSSTSITALSAHISQLQQRHHALLSSLSRSPLSSAIAQAGGEVGRLGARVAAVRAAVEAHLAGPLAQAEAAARGAIGQPLRDGHAARRNLAAALAITTHAAQLGAAARDLDELLQGGLSLAAAAAARVAEAAASARQLEAVSGFQDAGRSVDGWAARVLALADPELDRLVDAGPGAEGAAAQLVREVYAPLGRLDRVYQAFAARKKRAFAKAWGSFDRYAESERSNNGEALLASWLAEDFYPEADVLLKREEAWARAVLPEPERGLDRLLSAALSSLSPPCADRLRATSLAGIILAQAATRRFAASLDPAAFPEGARALFGPFLEFAEAYGSIEHAQLAAALKGLKLQPVPNFLEAVRNIEESCPRVLALLEAAVPRCAALTLGLAQNQLQEALTQAATEASTLMEAILSRIRVTLGLTTTTTTSHQTPSSSSSSSSSSSDVLIFDWSNCHAALQLCVVAYRFNAGLEELIGAAPGKVRALAEAVSATETERQLLASAVGPRGPPSQPAPPRATPSLAFRMGTRQLVFDTLFYVVRDRLSTLPHNPVWGSAAPRPTDVDGYEIPTFSLSPLPYVTQIGEHVLTLPQQLEPFSSSSDDTVHPRPPSHKDEQEFNFAFAWLTAITDSTVTLYRSKIKEIQSVSKAGAAQLTADIAYLVNVFAVLGVPAEEALSALRADVEETFLSEPEK